MAEMTMREQIDEVQHESRSSSNDDHQAPAADTAAREEPAREMSGASEEVEDSAGDSGDGIGFLSGIELQAAVELGRTELPIGEILGLRPGSVVELDKALGDPVELVVKDRVIARGEVVLVEDAFGLRVTDVVAREHE